MFDFTIKPFRKKDGTMSKIILVIGDDVDSTKPYKENMKNFGAKWISAVNTWGWFASQEPSKNKVIINKMVKPAIDFLISKEQKPPVTKRGTVDIINKLLSILDTENTPEEEEAMGNVYLSREEIKNKLYSFKEKLINTVNGEEFKKLMGPIMKARRAVGYQYSLLNTILIYMQDRNARMVKKKSAWAEVNRRVKPGSPAIWIWCPCGDKVFKTKNEKDRARERWMNMNHFRSESEMTVTDKENLEQYLNMTRSNGQYELRPSLYEYRYTEQIEGTEDLVGDPNAVVPWYDDSGKETMAVKEKIEALLDVVRDANIDVSSKPNLNGALGVSKGGKIEVLDNAKLNPNYLMVLIHEFSHELLHQTYLKDTKHPEYGQFYFGREEGKGFVEQQAELSAWLVCNFYNYDIKEGINYAGLWGMEDAKDAVHAFDTVARVSDFIINKMNKKIIANRDKMVKENRNYIKEVHFTGRDVAKLVGAEDIYDEGVEEIRNGEEDMQESIKSFKSMMERFNKFDTENKKKYFD